MGQSCQLGPAIVQGIQRATERVEKRERARMVFINSIQYAVKTFQLQQQRQQQATATGLAEGHRGGTGSDVRVSFIS